MNSEKYRYYKSPRVKFLCYLVVRDRGCTLRQQQKLRGNFIYFFTILFIYFSSIFSSAVLSVPRQWPVASSSFVGPKTCYFSGLWPEMSLLLLFVCWQRESMRTRDGFYFILFFSWTNEGRKGLIPSTASHFFYYPFFFF